MLNVFYLSWIAQIRCLQSRYTNLKSALDQPLDSVIYLVDVIMILNIVQGFSVVNTILGKGLYAFQNVTETGKTLLGYPERY